ncbi:hypothetical protein EJ06DRAFT_120277 [Trichodelitschia bisporula]|uniref:Uncharacterized protein n=1 Tax=Trichodelitschia bisporula TaxID=703511 RepID=A0A6G1HPW4_9PEZI|nr:hypothetical protein EJ06DRAFT_120277 [Trichodelitschia bisporula]
MVDSFNKTVAKICCSLRHRMPFCQVPQQSRTSLKTTQGQILHSYPHERSMHMSLQSNNRIFSLPRCIKTQRHELRGLYPNKQ